MNGDATVHMDANFEMPEMSLKRISGARNEDRFFILIGKKIRNHSAHASLC